MQDEDGLLSEQTLDELEELTATRKPDGLSDSPIFPCRFCPEAFSYAIFRDEHEEEEHTLHLGRRE